MTQTRIKNQTMTPHPEGEKLQKILARAGFGSRRSVEGIIAEGEVKVNGKVAQLGDRAHAERDKITVRNQEVRETRLAKQPTQVILYHKPEGQVCSRKDEKGRETIYEHLPRIINGRWVSIGRLDLNTAGLLILTNNGELANRMMHPSYEVEREYSVRVFGEVSDEVIKKLKHGVKLEDGMARFDQITHMARQDDDSVNQWYRVVIKEGRNREIRRMWESQDIQVSRLVRTRYGEFELKKSLRRGKTEELTWKQVNALLRSVGLKEEVQPDLRKPRKVDNRPISPKAYQGVRQGVRRRGEDIFSAHENRPKSMARGGRPSSHKKR